MPPREERQGQAADRYNPSKGNLDLGIRQARLPLTNVQSPVPDIEGKLWRRIQSGHPWPTRRSRNMTALKGQEWRAGQEQEADAYVEKWVRSNQQNGIDGRMADRANRLMPEDASSKREPFEPIRPGIEAGKWSTIPLALESFRKGDEFVMRSIARFLIKSGSLTELSDSSFLFPQRNERGEIELVPFMDWEYAIDEVFTDEKLWAQLSGMRGDLTPDKWPNGGASYKDVVARIQTDPEYQLEFLNPDGSLRPRKYLAQKLDIIPKELLNDLKKGSKAITTHHQEVTEWARKGRYGEGVSELPAKEMARLYVELSRTQAGRAQLAPLLGSPAQTEATNQALAASGFTYFTDVLGREYELTIENILHSGVNADMEITGMLHRGEEVPQPSPLEIG